jgi:CubicO group peptidase (beta-lactamase class C family)
MRADKRRHAHYLVRLATVIAIAGCGSTPKPKPNKPPAAAKEPWKLAVDAQVKPYLAHEIVTGVAIGIIDGEKQWTYGFGSTGSSGGKTPSATTLFELGAVTQVYTGVLVADAIERGELALDTELATLLPLGTTAPTRDGAAITVGHLVEHRAGLPDIPPTFARVPAPRYTVDALFADLGRTPLRFPPGQGFAYSTYGYAVLGAAVATKGGAASWGDAVETRVLGPLGLEDTAVAVPAGQSTRHAVGHADDGTTTAFGAFGALDPAMGLRSTVSDLLRFLRANLDAAADRPGPLAAALRRTHGVIGTGTGDNVTLGWYVDERGRRYHSGQTDGFHAFIELDLDKRKGVVVLAATATSLVDQLGDALMDVLEGTKPVPAKFPSPEQMMPLVGVYAIKGSPSTITIELDGKKLLARTPDGTRSRLMPAGGVRFYLERDRAFVTFDSAAPAQKFVLEAPQGQLVAERVVEPTK